MTIIRNSRGQIISTSKAAPAWATEEKLKRMILLPALRQLYAVQQFYQAGRSSIEIAAETGTTKHAIRTLLVRVRRALGVKREANGEKMAGARLAHVPGKHDQFHEGFEQGKHIPRSKGRHYHPVGKVDLRQRRRSESEENERKKTVGVQFCGG